MKDLVGAFTAKAAEAYGRASTEGPAQLGPVALTFDFGDGDPYTFTLKPSGNGDASRTLAQAAEKALAGVVKSAERRGTSPFNAKFVEGKTAFKAGRKVRSYRYSP
jgi:hypothetical protein